MFLVFSTDMRSLQICYNTSLSYIKTGSIICICKSAVQSSEVKESALQCIDVKGTVVQYIEVHCKTEKCSFMQCSLVPCSAI